MSVDRWREQVRASQQAYLEAVHEQALVLKAKDRDLARVAAYKELLEHGEAEAAKLALHGSQQ